MAENVYHLCCIFATYTINEKFFKSHFGDLDNKRVNRALTSVLCTLGTFISCTVYQCTVILLFIQFLPLYCFWAVYTPPPPQNRTYSVNLRACVQYVWCPIRQCWSRGLGLHSCTIVYVVLILKGSVLIFYFLHLVSICYSRFLLVV